MQLHHLLKHSAAAKKIIRSQCRGEEEGRKSAWSLETVRAMVCPGSYCCDCEGGARTVSQPPRGARSGVAGSRGVGGRGGTAAEAELPDGGGARTSTEDWSNAAAPCALCSELLLQPSKNMTSP